MNGITKSSELLAPAGNREKLETAIYYGADAVYLAGKDFGLRAFCDNFTDDELKAAFAFCHEKGRKAYVTLNIYASNDDLGKIASQAAFLQDAGCDGVIVSDLGVFSVVRKAAPELPVHVSTQANVTNAAAARFYAENGAKRIVLAREVKLSDIEKIRKELPQDVEIEAFVHGAMCVAYSGRCLLSACFTGRSANEGACTQSCRWEYALMEKTREGEYLPVSQDARGTYILNSKDLNMLAHLDQLIKAGVTSFKIEGRAKTAYYLATVVNAYRRALDSYSPDKPYLLPPELSDEPYKTSHRAFNTGFYFGEAEQNLATSKPAQTYEMCAVVLENRGKSALIEQRGRFFATDELEVLSPRDSFLRKVTPVITDEEGNPVLDAKNVQQRLILTSDFPLYKGDILRKKCKTASK